MPNDYRPSIGPGLGVWLVNRPAHRGRLFLLKRRFLRGPRRPGIEPVRIGCVIHTLLQGQRFQPQHFSLRQHGRRGTGDRRVSDASRVGGDRGSNPEGHPRCREFNCGDKRPRRRPRSSAKTRTLRIGRSSNHPDASRSAYSRQVTAGLGHRGIKLVVPTAVERIGDIQPPAVETELQHLRTTGHLAALPPATA